MSRAKRATSKYLKASDLSNMDSIDNIVNIKRSKRKQNNVYNTVGQFTPKEVSPLTINQNRLFDLYKNGKNLIASGCARNW